MKTLLTSLYRIVPAAALLLLGPTAQAVTFTSDTAISFDNTNYDGLDIVVTNCTLTVDGQHSFARLEVLNAGKLTHSFAPNGLLEYRRTITNEQQVLSVTHVASLANVDVVMASIVVQDFTGLVTYTDGVDYVTGLDTNGLTTLLLTAYSAIAEGGTNLVTYDVLHAPIAAGLRLTVTGDVTVAPGGMINADGKGYGGGLGYGAGRWSGSPLSGSGAGHGGYGGQSAALGGYGQVYDVIQQPSALGSGGGNGYGGVGGAGGGYINLIAGGNMRVDGTVSANGANGVNNRSGGGSGGGIWLSAQNFAGAGVISANGGAGEPSQGGGGGGGRISIQYAASAFAGTTTGRGGNGYICGGAGTIYTRINSQATGHLLVDNGGKSGTSTPLSPAEAVDLSVQGGALASLLAPQTIRNLLVGSNAWLSLSNQLLTVTSNATVRAGGGIIADGAGNAGNQGPGSGKSFSSNYGYTGGGGGFGGFGAAGGGSTAYGGVTYGSVIEPADLGSGGGGYPGYGVGGAGGGTVRLNVTGMLLCDGRISADGGAGFAEGSGGGSGGSLSLNVGALAGAGTITASGGSGSGVGLWGGGGGGGGRIAIRHGLNLFFGITSARGGSGAACGGAGTIYTKPNSQSLGQVLVDNGGQTGTNTTFGSTSTGTIDLTVRGGAVVSPPSSQTIGTLLVASNGWLSVGNQFLTVTGNATIQAGGGIIADGKGYSAGSGPGAGRYASTPSSGYVGGGAGYGGYGAAGGVPSGYSASGGNTYGSVTTPGDLGSGGGTYATYAVGGAGGGAVRLTVTGLLQVDGRISALGGAAVTPSAGGGSGGSIWLTVGTLAGSGIISANGGTGNYLGGGGGGGRIAILYGVYDFTGALSAYGGGGYGAGGAGTIYAKANSQSYGLLTLDNGGLLGTNTSLLGVGSIDLTVKGGAVVSPPSSQTFGTLLVASNGWVILTSQVLTVTGTATIQAGGGILADGTGSPAGQGSGAGRYYSTGSGAVGGGGGYGGYGAAGAASSSLVAPGGTTYGSISEPAIPGSGGGGYTPTAGGSGGGVIRLNVTGMLQVDGQLSAGGSPGVSPSAGGGSGGSIWLTVGTLAGSGRISANGGMGNSLGGGGGGGRIAVVFTTSTFSGLMSAYGGGGYACGGAGTIYSKANSQSSGLVTLDNGGQSGTNTSWATGPGNANLTVKGGAVFAPTYPSAPSVGTLLVASNGWVVLGMNSGSQAPSLTVSGNATVQAGGGIIADGTGYAAGQGSGAGHYASTPSGYVGSGGGHGGYGAPSGGSPAAAGGNTYDYVDSPSNPGSGGGLYSSTLYGGAGGGNIRLTVTGYLQVDGRISAAGAPTISPNSGGGSGGSIWLTVGALTGSGAISANGGAGNGLGGGGGGGRIAVLFTTSTFSGLMTAYGGGGYAWGGAGTIYTRASNQSSGLVTLDNGGQSGTNTPWATASGAVDLTVKGGAVFAPTSSGTPPIGTLVVASNGWVVLGMIGYQAPSLTVSGNATVQAGGGIIADGTGYAAGQGTGAGHYASTPSGYVGSGGGHGGYGAASGGSPAAAGGNTYDSVTAPINPGSGGGLYSTTLYGGAGGGNIRLTVTGSLQVDGRISAAGAPAISPNFGGGSGGSIWLTAGTLSGSGVISANGGAGNGLGGGGGGGRIAVQYTANTFSGSLSAGGGGGYVWGGAGTIYTKANSQPIGLVVLDNGGHSGTNTSSTGFGTVDLTLRGGAVLSLLNSQTFGNLLVASNGWILATSPSGSAFTMTVTSNATIQAGGGILADGTGYSIFNGGVGPGGGLFFPIRSGYGSGGGGYGGYGAASGGGPPVAGGGNSYGSFTQPGAGSAGGSSGTSFLGGPGGGIIILNVTGILQVDGRISAAGGNGISANSGGGSGGGINLTASTLAGSGVIAANGGIGNGLGGGGGGGRIALQYSANSFSGTVSAYGGGGYTWGGAGTIYSKATKWPWGQVLADNGGRAGTNTSWTQTGNLDLTVTGGAVVSPLPSQTFGNLLVTSNGWMSLSTQTLTVISNATIQAGGGILADGTGYAAGQGTGAGKYTYVSPYGYLGGGGGHAGYGAASGGPNPAAGGITYGSVTAPVDRGSGGGGGGSPSGPSIGGAGGGAMRLNVTGALLVNGRISANGSGGAGQGAGGGSGGSVWLTAGTLAGVGSISANGGAGDELGGGGGGGCISLQYGLNAFGGPISACGGGGYAWGGAGTIYTKANSMTTGQLVVDNAGHYGTNTPIASLSPFDLTVKGGAVAYPSSSSLTLSNLLVTTGGSFTCLKTQTNLDVAVLRNATIDASGRFTVDGKGFAVGTGPGAGLSTNSIGSGAGYGGSGGASSMLPGGPTYGSVQQPVDRGSGGGRGWGTSAEGSQGGGAIRLSVGGTLMINGWLSAGGNAGFQDDAGGGSGGSVWLTAGALAGAGAIAADGGAGELYDGGGGGGGRIAIYTPLNVFGGLVSAAGAEGAWPGQAGSIYYAGLPAGPQVISSTPAGALTATVSSAEIVFCTAINPYSVAAQNISLTAPDGLSVSNLTVTTPSPCRIHINFPQQTASGNYTLTLGPQVKDLCGQPMSQAYTGTFTIVWAAVQGTVTDINGLPVPGVQLQPDGGLPSTTTATDGNYVFSMPPVGTVNVVPSKTGLVFVPSSRTYANVTTSISNENYLAVSTVAPALATRVQTNTFILSWYGIPGVSYQPLYSTNLTDWLPYDGALPGTNGPLQLLVPSDTNPIMFFRVGASY